MAMLTHIGGSFKRATHQSGRQDAVGAGAAEAHLAMIKRFCIRAVTVLMAGAALAGIIALKATIYLSRFNY